MNQSNPERGHASEGQATVQVFAAWLVQFFRSSYALLYAQHSLKAAETGVYVTDFLPVDFTPQDWEEGRVFNDAFELRWQVKGDNINLLLLNESQPIPSAAAALCEWRITAEDYEIKETQQMLTGTLYRQGDHWFFAEASTPRKFCYPVDIASWSASDLAHAVLQGKYYRRNSRTVLTRSTRLLLVFEPREGGNV